MPSPARGTLAVLIIAIALIAAPAAEAGTLHQVPAPGSVSEQSAIVDPADGSLLFAWTTDAPGPNPITFCRVPVGASACSVSKTVGTPSFESIPRIVKTGPSTFRVVAVSSAGIVSYQSSDNGVTWAGPTVASASPGLSAVNVASRALLRSDGNVYIRTDSAVFRLSAATGGSFASVLLPFAASTEASNNPAIVPTSDGGLLTVATRYALVPQAVVRHVLPSGGTFTTPGAWSETATGRTGIVSGGASLAGPVNAAQPAVLATPADNGGSPSILLNTFPASAPTADAVLPGGPFGLRDPDDWVRSASGDAGAYRTVAWVGRTTGLERIRYATSVNGGAFSAASALYSTAVPDLSSSSVQAGTDDAGHGYLSWVQGGTPRFVDLTPVPDPTTGGGGGGGGGGTTKKPKPAGDPTVSVKVAGGVLRLTIGGTKRVNTKRCVRPGKKVTLKVTLKKSKAKVKRVAFRINGKTKKTDRKKPFKVKLKVKKAKGKRSVKFGAKVRLTQKGRKPFTKKLAKKVAFCK